MDPNLVSKLPDLTINQSNIIKKFEPAGDKTPMDHLLTKNQKGE
jgi:hypothetical protein